MGDGSGSTTGTMASSSPLASFHGGSVPMLGFGVSPSTAAAGSDPPPWPTSRTVAAHVNDGASIPPWIWALHHHVLLALEERAVVPLLAPTHERAVRRRPAGREDDNGGAGRRG